ncbi:MAG: hypothetical protein ABL914_11480 [Novosphingobium sp.]|uniref:hypothetical protein n=1 Tax=Novosphingobium sp. TaxID=1874826 RepID=UPI0032B997DE
MKARPNIRRRGQPLLALILLMVSWVGARAAMWEAPRTIPAKAAAARQADDAARPRPARSLVPAPPSVVPVERNLEPPVPLSSPAAEPNPAVDTTAETGVEMGTEPTAPAIVPAVPETPLAQTAEQSQPKRPSLRVLAGHAELTAIGMNIPTIEEGGAMDAARSQRFPATAVAAPQPRPRHSRWSVDAWLLLREGGNGFNAPGAGLPGVVVPVGFYGGSQAGTVLRYRLSLTSALRPELYLRGSSGLQFPRGEEVAAGFSIRPAPKVPLAVMAEARATRTLSGTRLRPAFAVVTELPPVKLPLGLRGEAYVQAGYVGGVDSSAFADGQARLERPLARSGWLEFRVGGGVWGGAQRGANRLDVGPTATLAVPIGPGGARISADYRIRVAGRAAPGNGAVLTLSAGF